MSRAVIDQPGLKVVLLGFLIALVLGLTLKAQIAPTRIQALLQNSVNRLEKDFIIDFQKAEIVLSKWGLPLPYLQITQVRMSPKKASCQDSQIYIENLILPVSPVSLVTSRTLVKELQATQVEVRFNELNNCLSSADDEAGSKKASEKSSEKLIRLKTAAAQQSETQDSNEDAQSVKNIFQIKTSALLEKIKIEQLKVISKKYPAQPLSFRQMVIELKYLEKQLDRVHVNTQVYALKDPQSELMFFKGDLDLEMISKGRDQVETEANLRGRLLDGEIKVYSIFNSLEQNIKMDFKAENWAIKPFVQLNLINSEWLNYPVVLNFRGYGQYQVDGSQISLFKLKDINILGEKTNIRIPEVNVRQDKETTDVEPFIADIKRLNLNKLYQLNQIKGISQSIENFGEISGVFNYKSKNAMSLLGSWSGLEFIFSNRGRRETQAIDSFQFHAQQLRDSVTLKLTKFRVNKAEANGRADLGYNLKTHGMQAEAHLDGKLLNPRIWELLTDVLQEPIVNLNWTFRKSVEERHQVKLGVHDFKLPGLQIGQAEINYAHSFVFGSAPPTAVPAFSQTGISGSSIALIARLQDVKVQTDELRARPLVDLFSQSTLNSEKSYTSDLVLLNFRGSTWKAMSFDSEARLKASTIPQPFVIRGRGEWSENETALGQFSVLNGATNTVQKFNMTKKESTFELAPL